jgi:DNA-binding transcriptional regulator GbsR (MarR family)
MTLTEKHIEFINLWGTIGTNWGINRSMAQVHALLLTSADPISTEDVMQALAISRGNANQTLRELISWGLVFKSITQGDRKEYFKAEQNIWTVAKRIIQERKKREIKPVEQALQSMLKQKNDGPEDALLNAKIQEILILIQRLDSASDALIKLEESIIVKTLLSITKLV